MTKTKRAKRRRGATLALVTTAVLVVLGAASLVVDLAMLYVRKQAHVNGCDAAAIAGAMELPEDPGAADARAREAAAANTLYAPIQVTVTFPSANECQVESLEQAPLLLARIFGGRTSQVAARARAVIGVANTFLSSPPNGLRPFGIDDDYYQQVVAQPPGTAVVMKLGARSTQGTIQAAGDFYPLRVQAGDSGGADFRERVKYGAEGDFQIGDWLPSEPGNMIGPTRQGVDFVIGQAAQAPWSSQTYETATMDNPRVFVVPIVNWDGVGNGQTDVQIVTFAAFYVIGVTGQEVRGYFLHEATISNGGIDPEGPAPPLDGLRVVKLIE